MIYRSIHPGETMLIEWYVIPLAVVLDLIAGDPPRWPHPVRTMGRLIDGLEPVFRKLPLFGHLAGLLFSFSLVSLTGFGIWALVLFLTRWWAPAGTIISVILIYYTISIRSLYEAAMVVYRALSRHDLVAARESVGMIVGRDTSEMVEMDVARATVETVAENFVDGVLAPLFFAALGGAPLAMVYRMINTLDAMVGYRTPAYRAFGWASARLDDLVNWLPARLAMPMIALAAHLAFGRGRKAWRTAWRDGRRHPSPNAGRPEAAFAGGLGVKLGGPSAYDGKRVDKPFLGDGYGDVHLEHIPKACGLMMVAGFCWAPVATLLSMAMAVAFG